MLSIIDHRKHLKDNVKDSRTSSEEMDRNEELDKLFQRLRVFKHYRADRLSSCDERQRLTKLAMRSCTDEVVRQWLRKNSETDTFSKLTDMFDFLKKHIDEEEKKNHSDDVHISFVAHSSIRDFMIPASCYLPLPTIIDVLLYSPWNCVSSGLAYSVATGKLRPQHRVFYCRKEKGCTIPDDKHRPVNLPDHWNSLKKAGAQMVPNITVSPLSPDDDDDGVWKDFESLSAEHGPPGRNRIVIPFILPGREYESIPFSVVTLALSLVLLSSRFKATLHFSGCLGDQSTGQKFDRKYLQEQYACTIDKSGMKCSPEAFR
ncbi:uncharacterized protein LOC106096515 isoform X1 [Oreochromis niloticus]|uniref:uncharacterized protein LOC106096515 isoform X1 n=2 Tax=Oreochromis niloticus TaxID=8128 RepID=UPI0006744CAD|nr:uncharacterized protein LOC106096515 isoform X1 [Oreochromis niloticus]